MSNTPVTIVYDAARQAKGRPRFGKNGIYTPATMRQFQHDFGWHAKAAMAGRPPFTGAVTITALFEVAIPKSWTARPKAVVTVTPLHNGMQTPMTTDLACLLQEIAVTETAADINAIAARAVEVIAGLPPHQREGATECVQDAIRGHDERKT